MEIRLVSRALALVAGCRAIHQYLGTYFVQCSAGSAEQRSASGLEQCRGTNPSFHAPDLLNRSCCGWKLVPCTLSRSLPSATCSLYEAYCTPSPMRGGTYRQMGRSDLFSHQEGPDEKNKKLGRGERTTWYRISPAVCPAAYKYIVLTKYSSVSYQT